MKTFALHCKGLRNPVGIDTDNLTFGWKLEAEGYGKKQSAYRILAYKDLPVIDDSPLWDTGKIESSSQTAIPYGGLPLKSRERVQWRVKVWDENDDEGDWSDSALFEIGLLSKSDWSALWLDPQPGPIDPDKNYPASYLRKTFVLDQEASSSRIYSSAHGIYEIYINGNRVGNEIFKPGCTNYDKHLQYQTLDPMPYLKTGENEIQAVIGDGWFRGQVGPFGFRNVFGNKLGFIMQLEINLSDDDKLTIVTDDSWEASQDGCIRENDLRMGEVYDARKKLDSWHEVSIEKLPAADFLGLQSPPCIEHENLTPEVIITPSGETVLDFKQNLVGYVEFSIQGSEGHAATLVHGEVLDEDGNFTTKNFQIENIAGVKTVIAEQKIQYILNGAGREYYKPRFTFHGFRYVLLRDWPEPVRASNFKAIVVHSDLEELFSFRCSKKEINRLFENVRWSQKGNFLDIPTDCPQREKAGWTGDIQVYGRTASYMMDTSAFLRKWLRDLAVQQRDDGLVSNITPSVGFGKSRSNLLKATEGSAGWGDAAVIVPYTLFKMYGDKTVLSDQWDSMKSWVDYEISLARKTHWCRLLKNNPFKKYTWDTKYHWGEWLEAGDTEKIVFRKMMKRMFFSEPEVATAYLAYSSGLLSEIAGILKKDDDEKYYKDYSQKAREAYRYNFLKKKTFRSKRQCLFVRPLALELADDEMKASLARRLSEKVKSHNHTINTGFLSTANILKVLSDNGYIEDAYTMLEQPACPGWLYPISKGATTIWESWNAIDEDNRPAVSSMNHYAYGAVAGWFADTILGIDQEKDSFGFSKPILAPKPGGTLTCAEGSYKCIKGTINSSWKKNDNGTEFSFSIPPNMEARLILPVTEINNIIRKTGDTEFHLNNSGLAESRLCSGEYTFQVNGS